MNNSSVKLFSYTLANTNPPIITYLPSNTIATKPTQQW